MPKQKPLKKIVLGLTGGFGTGKTTVALFFKKAGAKVIDADELAHKCLARGKAPYKKIIRIFGKDILGKNREIDRKKLAGYVFGDRKKVKQLNNIIHPEVIKKIRNKIKQTKKGIIVLDVPLLVEAGLTQLVDKLIVVIAIRKNQVRRIQKRTHLPKREIIKRINLQIPLSRKARLADFVIDNNGTIEKTKKQVVKLWRELWKN